MYTDLAAGLGVTEFFYILVYVYKISSKWYLDPITVHLHLGWIFLGGREEVIQKCILVIHALYAIFLASLSPSSFRWILLYTLKRSMHSVKSWLNTLLHRTSKPILMCVFFVACFSWSNSAYFLLIFSSWTIPGRCSSPWGYSWCGFSSCFFDIEIVSWCWKCFHNRLLDPKFATRISALIA